MAPLLLLSRGRASEACRAVCWTCSIGLVCQAGCASGKSCSQGLGTPESLVSGALAAAGACGCCVWMLRSAHKLLCHPRTVS